jgi:hypothetical protein
MTSDQGAKPRDTQNTAPEKVWILRDLQGGVHVYDESGDAPEETRDDVGYIRADVAEAMVAAALEEAAEVAANEADYVPVKPDDFRKAIRALIPNRSILAKRDAQMRAEGLQEAAEYLTDTLPMHRACGNHSFVEELEAIVRGIRADADAILARAAEIKTGDG